MNTELELLVTEGPLKGRRFAVPAEGLRLGRSSSCEISIPDPALSRNHCLFEMRDGGLWVTDLASANGTIVNDVQLGPDSQCIKAGDRVLVGDSVLQAVSPGGAVPPPAPAPAPAPAADIALPTIDLGLGGGEPLPEEASAARPSKARLVLWGVALVSVLAAVALVLMPVASGPEAAVEAIPEGKDELVSFTFEKVKADARTIYRYALAYDGQSLHVAIDDVPESNRHVKKSVELSADARKRLGDILSTSALAGFAPEYVGTPADPGTLQSFELHVVRSRRAFDVSVENKAAPEDFREICGRLETFAKSELGIWAIQSSVPELLALSADARRVADAKWNERESNYGNLAESLRKYDEALQYLETVDPKPADFEDMRTRRSTVKAELDRVYRLHRGNADQAIGTQNWTQARYELHVLLELVPDAGDERNRDASRKLQEVEDRMKAKR